MKMNKPSRDPEGKDLETYPLEALKQIYAADYGSPEELEAVPKQSRVTYQERELNLIKEMQEGSESDEQDSFLRSHGEIRDSSGKNSQEEKKSQFLLRRMDAIRERQPVRAESPRLPESPGTGSSGGGAF